MLVAASLQNLTPGDLAGDEGGEGGADVDDGLLDDLGVVSPFQNRDVDSIFRILGGGGEMVTQIRV